MYYAYRSDKFEDFRGDVTDIKHLSQEVKKFVGEDKVVKGGCNPKKALFLMEDNIKNAEQNYCQDKDGLPSQFSTDMYKLAKEVYPKVKGLIKELIEGRERNRIEVEKCVKDK